MYSLGLLALQREQYSLAVQCFIGYIESLAGRLGLYNPEEFERHIPLARSALGQPAFEALVSVGRKMSLEGAVDFALVKAG